MKSLLSFALLPFVAGCLSARLPDVSHWPVDYVPSAQPVSAKFGVARISQVSVRTPYDVEGIVVLRADGSVAFDSYNVFAAAPGMLLRGVVFDALANSGLFASVVNASSTASSAVSVELMVTRLALDCRADDPTLRKARVEIILRLIDAEGGLVKTLPASGEASAEDGNYGLAFSTAVSQALEKALSDLR